MVTAATASAVVDVVDVDVKKKNVKVAHDSYKNGAVKSLSSGRNLETRAETSGDFIIAPHGIESTFKASEVVRLAVQALQDMGYNEAARAVEKHTGVPLIPSTTQALLDRLMTSDWDGALCVLEGLDLTKNVTMYTKFLVLQQKFFELLLRDGGLGITDALKCLRHDLSPLIANTYNEGLKSHVQALTKLLIVADTLTLKNTIAVLAAQTPLLHPHAESSLRDQGADIDNSMDLPEHIVASGRGKFTGRNGQVGTKRSRSSISDSTSNDIKKSVISGGSSTSTHAENDKEGGLAWTIQLRTKLSESIVNLLPKSQVVPKQRLFHLLDKAIQLQLRESVFVEVEQHARKHGTPLLEDLQHIATRQPQLPRRTVQVLRDHNSEVWRVSFSHNGKFLASASRSGCVILWRVQEPSDVGTSANQGPLEKLHKLEGHANASVALAWSKTDKHLVSVSKDEPEVCLWRCRDGKLVVYLATRLLGVVQLTSVCWVRTDETFLTAGVDGSIVLWDVHGHKLSVMKHAPVYAMVYSEPMKALIVSCAGRQAKVYALDVDGMGQSESGVDCNGSLAGVAQDDVASETMLPGGCMCSRSKNGSRQSCQCKCKFKTDRSSNRENGRCDANTAATKPIQNGQIVRASKGGNRVPSPIVSTSQARAQEEFVFGTDTELLVSSSDSPVFWLQGKVDDRRRGNSGSGSNGLHSKLGDVNNLSNGMMATNGKRTSFVRQPNLDIGAWFDANRYTNPAQELVQTRSESGGHVERAEANSFERTRDMPVSVSQISTVLQSLHRLETSSSNRSVTRSVSSNGVAQESRAEAHMVGMGERESRDTANEVASDVDRNGSAEDAAEEEQEEEQEQADDDNDDDDDEDDDDDDDDDYEEEENDDEEEEEEEEVCPQVQDAVNESDDESEYGDRDDDGARSELLTSQDTEGYDPHAEIRRRHLLSQLGEDNYSSVSNGSNTSPADNFYNVTGRGASPRQRLSASFGDEFVINSDNSSRSVGYSSGSSSNMSTSVTPVKTLTFDESVMSLSLSADGKLALLGFTGHVIQSLDLDTLKPLQQYVGHRNSKLVIGTCLFGSRQRYVASGSEDFNVYLWHATPAALHGTLVAVLAGHSAATNDVAWCQQNPRLLVSASDDGTLRCWTQ